MTLIQLSGIVFSVVMPGNALLWWLGSRRGKKLGQTESVDLVQRLTRQLEQTTAHMLDWQRRTEENRQAIERVLKERDAGWKLYDEQAIAHGNAQVMMMNWISHLERRLLAYGVQMPLPEIIRETQALYLQEHVDPVIARAGVAVVTRGVPPDQKEA